MTKRCPAVLGCIMSVITTDTNRSDVQRTVVVVNPSPPCLPDFFTRRFLLRRSADRDISRSLQAFAFSFDSGRTSPAAVAHERHGRHPGNTSPSGSDRCHGTHRSG